MAMMSSGNFLPVARVQYIKLRDLILSSRIVYCALSLASARASAALYKFADCKTGAAGARESRGLLLYIPTISMPLLMLSQETARAVAIEFFTRPEPSVKQCKSI